MDRFFVYDTATARARALEAPAQALDEGGVNAGPRQPLPEGSRVAADVAPLQRYAPVTGVTLLRAEGGCPNATTPDQ